MNEIERANYYKELLEKYGSPLYVYKEDILRDRCQKILNFKNIIERSLNGIKISMHYSTKANNNPAILKIVKEFGIGVDCMSLLELHINQKCGFKEDNILYVCNNIDEEEMKAVYDSNILICLDSISQMETWGKMFPNTSIMIRINPGIEGVGHSKEVVTSGKETKFGITENNFEQMFNVANNYSLNIIGVHQHLGSLFLNDKIDDYINGVKRGLSLINKYSEFNNVEVIDLGGGFGVPYKGEDNLDFSILEENLIEVLKNVAKKHTALKELKFEPGRYIPCESGFILGKVTAIKHENNIYWIGTDIGMNQLVRPSMYDAYHEIEIIGNNNSIEVEANICGNICESGDILAKHRKIKLPDVGDIILVYNAGAYGYSMASNYTGRLRPAEVMINNNHDRLIRKRETIDYIESNIIWD